MCEMLCLENEIDTPQSEQEENSISYVVKCPECRDKCVVNEEPDTVQNPAGEYLLFCKHCRNFHYREITGGK